MSFFKKLFGGKEKQTPKTENTNQTQKEKSQDTEEAKLTWIEAADNPWGVRLLDLRPVTQHMLSSSKDPRMAQNAISYQGEDGTFFYDQLPKTGKTIVCDIRLSIDKALYAGVLFTPDTMENKWAIYFDGHRILFIRSWMREVFVVAETRQENNKLIIEKITGEFTNNEEPEFTKAVLKFILISHCLNEVMPAPLPLTQNQNLYNAALWAFSAYGNKAHVGCFELPLNFEAESVLRTHTLLHIAVARNQIKAIEEYVNQGININALAGDGLSVLQWALATKTTDAMTKLLELGADPNVKSHEGATPLMNAVQSNRSDAFNLLLKHGAEINTQDLRGFTALHRAAEMGHIELVKLLLASGADKTISANGQTALTLATARNQKEIITLLQ